MITCASSRAVHLETTRSLAVKDFILALQRFMDIRGVPAHIESDNSKTFIRANKEFASIFNSKRARRFFQQNRIEWNFYTEHSPWKGGMTERLNATFKKIARKKSRRPTRESIDFAVCNFVLKLASAYVSLNF